MTTRTGTDRLRIVESFPEPGPHETENPYCALLIQSLSRHADVQRFTWRAVLAGRYDVFHVHWPEFLLDQRPGLSWVRSRGYVVALLIRLLLGRVLLVRTMHNLAPHEAMSRIDRALLWLLDRSVGLRVFLIAPDRALRDDELVLPHGTYADWYPVTEQASRPGRLVCFGQLRPYKGVEELIAAFAAGATDAAELVIAGAPVNREYADRLTASAAVDQRITVDARSLSDVDLASLIASAEAIVLPYRRLYNSGAAILALTLHRPVIVPASVGGSRLTAELGDEWVATYPVPLDAAGLAAAVDQLTAARRHGAPPFVNRDWEEQAITLLSAMTAIRRGEAAPTSASGG